MKLGFLSRSLKSTEMHCCMTKGMILSRSTQTCTQVNSEVLIPRKVLLELYCNCPF